VTALEPSLKNLVSWLDAHRTCGQSTLWGYEKKAYRRMGIFLAIASAALTGVADVCAALAARRLGAMTTALLSLLTSAVMLTLGGAGAAGVLHLDARLFLLSLPGGLLAGIMTAVGYASGYRGLSQGPIAIVSPIIASDGAIAGVLAILLLHEHVSLWQGGTLSAVFLGVVLASTNFVELSRLSCSAGKKALARGGMRWGIVAALAFGLMLFCIGVQSQQWGVFPSLFWSRLVAACALGGALAYKRRGPSALESGGGRRLEKAATGLAICVGLLETTGLLLYGVAARIAETSVVATIVSTFTLIPLFVGIVFFRERPVPNQVAGVCLVLCGLILLGIRPV
jgi:drug/metabolite transporter (DMT)-like permease